MRTLSLTGLGLIAAAPFLFSPSENGSRTPDGSPPDTGRPEDVCATGCAAIPPSTDRVSVAEIESLLATLASEETAEGSDALEALLFHGADVRAHWDALDLDALDDERRQLLRREIARTHAQLDVRFVGEDGHERLRLGSRRVPLGIKEHLFPDHAGTLQPPEVSGTVRRVGLKHLWARL